MAKYVCAECLFEYSEEDGCPQCGVAPGTKWSAVPESFACPQCGAARSSFLMRMTSGIYVCSMCGFRYEEARGNKRADLPAGTPWSSVPETFKCPVCGCPKNIFKAFHDDGFV